MKGLGVIRALAVVLALILAFAPAGEAEAVDSQKSSKTKRAKAKRAKAKRAKAKRAKAKRDKRAKAKRAKAKRAKAKRAKAKRDKRAKAKKRRRKAKRSGRRICRGKGKKRRCRWVPYFSGKSVAEAKLRTDPLPKPSGDIWIYAVNFREEYKLNIYKEDGTLDEAKLADLDRGFRCRRTKEERAVDPRLYEILSIIQDHFGGKRIELVSGFRFQRNEGSRHFHASAMDIRIPGVSIRELYEYAQSLDTGGMGIGIYPRSRFVHVDFRGPGVKSYRWKDMSRPGGKSSGKRPSRRWKRKPTS